MAGLIPNHRSRAHFYSDHCVREQTAHSVCTPTRLAALKRATQCRWQEPLGAKPGIRRQTYWFFFSFLGGASELQKAAQRRRGAVIVMHVVWICSLVRCHRWFQIHPINSKPSICALFFPQFIDITSDRCLQLQALHSPEIPCLCVSDRCNHEADGRGGGHRGRAAL